MSSVECSQARALAFIVRFSQIVSSGTIKPENTTSFSALTSGMPDNYGCPGFGSVDFRRTLARFFSFVSSRLARNQGAS